MKTRFIAEDDHSKAYDSKLIKRLLTEVAPLKRYVIIAFIFLLLTSLLSLVGPYLIKIAIDGYIRTGDLSGLSNIAIFYIIVLIFAYITEYIRIYYTQFVGQKRCIRCG